MSRRPYSGEEIIKALSKWDSDVSTKREATSNFAIATPKTGEKRTVSVPLHDELATGTLRGIAEQAGANEFQEFLDAIDDLL